MYMFGRVAGPVPVELGDGGLRMRVVGSVLILREDTRRARIVNKSTSEEGKDETRRDGDE